MVVRPPVPGRSGKFVAVGLLGFVVQTGVLAFLVHVAHWAWLPATVAAVELAIVHNYLWHRGWTWGDRTGSFLRFNASTALTSVVGNVAITGMMVAGMDMAPVPANAIAVGIMSAVNFAIADRCVFSSVLLVLAAPSATSAAPPPEALEAWGMYVQRAETRIAGERGEIPQRDPQGESIDVAGGTIHRWRGAVFIAGVTVDEVLRRLQDPGTPPPQEDVTASRVLARGPDSLRVYIRLVRRAIVTMSYDTEHEMTFRRESPGRATARSVATRIEQVGGGDSGLLWRLNSYWRYAQAGDGVLVVLESLTLSRRVPLVLRPVAARIVPRIARESVARTLEALRRFLEPVAAGRPVTMAPCEWSTAQQWALRGARRISSGRGSTTPTSTGRL